jgi:hypothetical protein
MNRQRALSGIKVAVGMTLIFVFISFGMFNLGEMPIVHAQQPTGSIPTVTGTAEGPSALVDSSLTEGILVYAGPSTFDYEPVGYLLANETVYLIGRAEGKDDWFQIYYPGVPGSTAWVYALYLVKLSQGGKVPVVEIPPTPTPNSTPTINPTLEAAFIGQKTATRLPSFTPPPPLDLPQFTDVNPPQMTRGIPAGLIILSLGLFGFFGAVISYLRGR